jgi:signal peptidase II
MSLPTERPYYWLFAALAVLGLSVDLASKYVVFANLYPENDFQTGVRKDVIPGYFALQTHWRPETDKGDLPLSFLRTIQGERLPALNQGALFGLGNSADGSGGWNNVFAAISLLAAVFILFWASRPAVAQDRWLSLALGLILGGTLGNLYDRIVFGGVRDFLHCYYEHHVWPDFNIADSCLVVGAGVLLVHSFLVKEPEPDKVEPAASTQTAAMPDVVSEPHVSNSAAPK